MNRLIETCFLGVFAALGLGCAVSGVGDPCIPEDEFDPKFGQSVLDDLAIDVNSVQCETRVCLRHYFRGRVSCPLGNGSKGGQTGTCSQVSGVRGLYTLDGTSGGEKCCPVLGDLNQTPISKPVDAQCAKRPAKDSVYCSCRCDVPDDPDIDRSKVTLCKCPTGFTCKPLCDKTNGNCSIVPKGKWGSYCVRDGANGAAISNGNQAEAACGGDLTAVP